MDLFKLGLTYDKNRKETVNKANENAVKHLNLLVHTISELSFLLLETFHTIFFIKFCSLTGAVLVFAVSTLCGMCWLTSSSMDREFHSDQKASDEPIMM